jgi:hypothetical protein
MEVAQTRPQEQRAVPPACAEVDVWWGTDGIDALRWPKPYRPDDYELRDTSKPEVGEAI